MSLAKPDFFDVGVCFGKKPLSVEAVNLFLVSDLNEEVTPKGHCLYSPQVLNFHMSRKTFLIKKKNRQAQNTDK